jgi:hypothetical protein
VEAWRILWPVPPLRVGPSGPIGLDACEIRARVRPGFDPSRILALCLAAEVEALTAFTPKRGDDHGTSIRWDQT